MCFKKMCYFIFLVFVIFIPCSNAMTGPARDSLNIQWIYSNDRKDIDRVPKYYWTENDKIILYDEYQPENERSFMLLDPVSGTSDILFDMDKAVSEINTFLDEKRDVLCWPEEFDAAGKYAVYTLENDLFLLNVKKSEIKRITHNAETDTCPRFSPDGLKIAYVRSNNLYLFDLPSGEEIQLTRDGSDTILNGILSWVYWEEIFGHDNLAYWWSPDSRRIAYFRTDESTVNSMTFVDFCPQTPRVIVQKYPKAGQKNPVVRLGLVDIDQRQTRWIGPDPETYEYLVRVKWLPDNRHLSIQTLNRSQDELDFYLIDTETGKHKVLFVEKNPGWVTIHDDLVFLKYGQEFLWASERDGYNHLYCYGIDGSVINQVTRGKWSLRSSGGGVAWVSDAICAVDEENEWVYLTALEKSSIERHLYRIRLDGTEMSRISQQDGVHRISFSPNFRYYLDEYSSSSSPPELLLYESNGKLINVIEKSPPKDILKNLQYRQFFTIAAQDGFEMPAYFIRPAHFDPAKKYPVIINIYGGPSSPKVVNQWDDDTYFDNLLLNNGFLVFSIDNRSASGISKTLQIEAVKQLWGDIELSDLLDAVKWLKSQPYVDSSRIGIWGWSGGGMHTLLAMTRSGEFKAGIAVAPVTDWMYYDTRYTEFAMKTPQDNPEGYRKTSLVRRAADLHGRLMIVHGTYDDNVHPQNTWAFVHELIRHNIQFDMMMYPMRKHSIRDDEARIHLYTCMLEFWKLNL
ncbi:MAG: hypothetical protein EH225_00165 [Calditrichaeota bacterium]|nr:DPP IV N-terminal domain-containing protein [Calditrichota bacterium]RQW08544.1 MAG: hypothetical protein EH225_00165 [Calditrichota bacterium]